MYADPIIMGDFNIDLIQDNYKSRKWKHLMNTFGLTQMVNEPTRVTENSATLIDHVYIADSNLVQEIYITVPNITISDHYPIVITMKSGKKREKKGHKYTLYRNFKNFDEDSFRRDLATANWNLINDAKDPNVALTEFNKIILNTLNRHAPMKTKRVKKQVKPKWFNTEVQFAICKRNKIRRSSPSELRLAQKKNKIDNQRSKIKVL